MKFVVAMALVFCAQGAGFAQVKEKPAEFEEATVKQAAPASPQPAGELKSTGAGIVSVSADRASYEGVTLKRLLMSAYDMKPLQITGPAWIETERYDVVATIPDGTPKEDIPAMLQHLLADRFQITQHTEVKDEPVYLLGIGPNGPKLRPSSSDHPQSAVVFTIGATGVTGMRYAGNTMTDFANALTTQLGRTVTDRTGLAGRFDIALPLSEHDLQPGSDTLAASLLTAVKNVGLKLDPGKAPMKHLVVDTAEKVPTED